MPPTDERNSRAQPLCVRAPAKVNLYLEVRGRRPDGYHDLCTVMQAVSLFDELAFQPRPDGVVTLSCAHPDLGDPDVNLVTRAARALQAHCGVRQGADVTLCKRIPVEGGLGGGSSDGAVTLLALNHLWGLDVPLHELAELAAGLGSDAAFFIRGGTALCEGRGERVTPLPCPRAMHYVLVTPACRSATGEVYRAWRGGLTGCDATRKNVLEALSAGDAALLAASLRNDLQETALTLQTELRELWGELRKAREDLRFDGFMLTGSGASFVVVAEGEHEAVRMANRLSAALGTSCHAVHSMPAWNGSILPLMSEGGHR
jgi:4-diphosphocytidyl-2-C-methyl-D-erythritol kinase